MKKRGISPLIATILIIGFTIVLAALVMTWGMDLYKSIREEQELKAETELICASKIAPVVKASCLRLLPYVKTEIQNNGENEIISFILRAKSEKGITVKNFTTKINPYGVIKSFMAFKVSDGIVNEIEFIPYVNVKDKVRACKPFKFSLSCDVDFSNLVGFWPMDEGSGNIVYDYSINKNDGTIHGATWIDARTTKGLSFTTSEGNYVDCGDDPSLDTSDAVTIEAWITTNSFVYWNTLVSRGADFMWVESGYLLWWTGSAMYFWINNYQNYASVPLSDTTGWHQVVGTYDKNAGVIKIYLDGVEGVSAKYSEPIKFGGSPLTLGAAGFPNYLHWNGLIDEISIYNRALTQEEIKQIYNELK